MAEEKWEEILSEDQVKVLDMPRAPAPVPVDYSKMIAVVTTWKKILNARLLALLALIGALFIYGLAMYDPTNLRLTCASLYSMGVLWPIIALYYRKG